MTREDAIFILHGIRADNLNLDDLYTKDKYEALGMAIKALEQQTCEDCISREAVIDHINLHPYVVGNRSTLVLQIKLLPSVIPKGVTITDFADRCRECGKIKSCDDAISRADVLALAEKGTLVSNGNYKSVCKAINELPSVTPKAEWIPVSERLPEDYTHVLCQFYLGGMGECYLAHGVFHVVDGLVMTCNEVIAWMPLPEPYKAESEE